MTIDLQRGAQETPADFEARIHALSTMHRTPMSEGMLVWHQWGDADKPPLLLFHGGFGSWRHWINNVVELSQHFQVFCIDLPGLGESDKLPGEYTPHNIADEVLRGIDGLLGREAQFHLAGFSFGGIVALHLGVVASHRIHQLVAIAPGALGVPGTIPELQGLGGQRDRENVARIHHTNLGRLMIHDDSRIDDLAIHLQFETVRRARAPSGRIPFTDAAGQALAKCTCPVAGVWGECDVIAKDHMQERIDLFRSHHPDCPFEVVKDAGHWVMYEQAEAFNKTLLGLLI